MLKWVKLEQNVEATHLEMKENPVAVNDFRLIIAKCQ